MPSLGYMPCPHHRAIYTSRYLKRPSRQTSSPISNPRPRMTSNAPRLASSRPPTKRTTSSLPSLTAFSMFFSQRSTISRRLRASMSSSFSFAKILAVLASSIGVPLSSSPTRGRGTAEVPPDVSISGYSLKRQRESNQSDTSWKASASTSHGMTTQISVKGSLAFHWSTSSANTTWRSGRSAPNSSARPRASSTSSG